ncbi:hypothetical protein ACO0QE_001506 [Hanseniaspora vineae]
MFRSENHGRTLIRLMNRTQRHDWRQYSDFIDRKETFVDKEATQRTGEHISQVRNKVDADETKSLEAALARSKVFAKTVDTAKDAEDAISFLEKPRLKNASQRNTERKRPRNNYLNGHSNNAGHLLTKRHIPSDSNSFKHPKPNKERGKQLKTSNSLNEKQSPNKPTKTPVFIEEIQKSVLDVNTTKKSVKKLFTSMNLVLQESENFQLRHIDSKDAILPPTLKHGIDYALFQPLTFQLVKDKRSGKSVLGESVSTPINVHNFNYDALPKYKTPSEDKVLLQVAKDAAAKFYSSSSSMTGALSQIHFFLSNFRPVKHHYLSKTFETFSDYAMSAKQAVSLLVQRKSDDQNVTSAPVYSISNDKSADTEIILSRLGHALETQLTTTKEDFDKNYDKSHPNYSPNQDTTKLPEQDYFHYSKISNFVLRSQLDSHHPDLPGSGVFDLKTRAVSAIRHDLAYVQRNNNFTGYALDKVYGTYESFEREFYDLSKLTLLKYGLQAKIGNMDGIFLAYHNISKIFGFQYLPLEEIQYILSSYHCDLFKSELQKRKELLKILYTPAELVSKELLPDALDKSISKAIMDQEYKFSFQVLNKMLNLIHSELNNCSDFRLMIKAEPPVNKKDEATDVYRDDYEKSTLYFFAVPLASEDVRFLEERSLKTSLVDANPEKVDEFLNDLSHFNKTHFANKLLGFKLTINKQEVQGNGEKLPAMSFSSERNSSALAPRDAKKLEQFINGEGIYKDFDLWEHPYFFHPNDVRNWNISCKIEKINSPLTKAKMYSNYLDEKMRFVKSNIEETRLYDKEEVNKLGNVQASSGKKVLTKKDLEKLKYLIGTQVLPRNYRSSRQSYDDLKQTLRAYGQKS